MSCHRSYDMQHTWRLEEIFTLTPISINPLRNTWILIAVTALVTTAAPTTRAAVLYDASQNTLPSPQGWTFFDRSFFDPSAGAASQSVVNGVYTFDSTDGTDNSTQAGISRFDQTLDADTGYTLRFDLRIDSEDHTPDDRAGFSVIVVSSNTDQALELAFWENEIWAQEDDDDPNQIFVASHAEGTDTSTTDTTADIVRYDLTVQGNSYELFADGNSILTGPLRDYTAWISPFGSLFDPYKTENFIFLGDDTTSARGIAEITRIELNPIPEPASAVAWLIGAASVAYMRRQHRRVI